MRKEKIINLPNILALIRLLLVPVVVWLIFQERMITAMFVFLAACLTDLLDGYIARRYHLITQLGTFLDPMADKLMAVFVIIAFTAKGILPLAVTIVIFAKELLMLVGGSPSSTAGGIKTTTLAILLLALRAAFTSDIQHGDWHLFPARIPRPFLPLVYLRGAGRQRGQHGAICMAQLGQAFSQK